jgi:hypothetical protein
LREVASVLDRTYAADEAVGSRLERFNFWYLTTTATAGGGCVRSVPSEYWRFGDAGAIVHADQFRDCASGGVFSSEPYEIHTFMYETGHAVFRLSDLYSGAQGLSEQPVWPNVYRTRASCEADANLHGWRPAGCTSFRHRNGSTGYRIDRNTSVMGTCGGPYPRCVDQRFAFDRGSRRRVVWYLEGLEQEPPPLLLARGVAFPGVSLLIEFRTDRTDLVAVADTLSVVNADAPEAMRTDEAMRIDYLDAAGAVVATYWAEDPRIGRTIDRPFNLMRLAQPSAMRLPLVGGAVSIRISSSSIADRAASGRAVMLRLDLEPAIARFCADPAAAAYCAARSPS